MGYAETRRLHPFNERLLGYHGLISWARWRLQHDVIRVDSAEQHHVVEDGLQTASPRPRCRLRRTRLFLLAAMLLMFSTASTNFERVVLVGLAQLWLPAKNDHYATTSLLRHQYFTERLRKLEGNRFLSHEEAADLDRLKTSAQKSDKRQLVDSFFSIGMFIAGRICGRQPCRPV